MTTTWSQQQKDIFQWFATGSGNLVVRARAGTGKTTTAVEAISFAPEGKLLFAAFNKKIADELGRKIKNPKASSATLHSVGFEIVRRNWSGVRVDKDRGWRLAKKAAVGDATPDDMTKLIANLASKAKGISLFPTIERLVEIAVEFDLEPKEEWQQDNWTTSRVADCAKKAMALALIKDGTVDFDDMVYLAVAQPGWANGRYDLVVIDECQDMNEAQILLAQKVVKKGGRVVVIGDDRQAIYGFRGADSGSLDRLKVELKAKELPLTTTYRCPKLVVEIAAKLVPDYQAAPEAPQGEVRKTNYEGMLADANVGSFVLSRKNAPLVRTALKLLALNKPAKVEGRDIGAGLKAVIKNLKAKAKDVREFIAKVEAWEEKETAKLSGNKKLAAKLDQVCDQAACLYAIATAATSIQEIEARVDGLFADNATPECYIVCSSVHKAKGLERDTVYVLDDTFYIKNADRQEETNIEYVAVTRTKRVLVRVSGLP